MKLTPPSQPHKRRTLGESSPLAPAPGRCRADGLRLWLLLAALAASAPFGIAQEFSEPVFEPQALRLQVTNASVGLLIDGEEDKTSDTGGGPTATATYTRWFIGPVFGLDASGSIYHPNLLSFDINGEISPGYTFEKETPALTNSNQGTGFTVLGNYTARFTFLQNKPYSADLFVSQSYTDEDTDFFNHQQVNVLSYGATLGYRTGPVPFSIGLTRQQQDTYGGPYEVSSQSDQLTANARNTRASGETSFTYAYTDTSVSQLGVQGGGPAQTVSLADAETFGSNKQIQFNNSAGYSTQSNGEGPADDLNAASHLTIELTPTLTNSIDANYDRENTASSDGTQKANDLSGDISLSHQLYESLTSVFSLQGLDYSSNSNLANESGSQSNSGSRTIQFGGSLSEAYSKRLAPSIHLSLGASISYEHTIQNDTGSILLESDEAHTFSSDTGSFYLNLPYVDPGSIVVTDSKGTLPAYQAGIDYIVSEDGPLTMIRRSAASTIPQNAKVLVTYTATAPPSGQYDSLGEGINGRVDFWNGALGVYANWNSISNFGASGLFSQVNSTQNIGASQVPAALNLSSYSVGADGTWRWLRAGVEYEVYNSPLSSSRSVRLNQSVAFKLDSRSTFNVGLAESQTSYSTGGYTEEDCSCISHFTRRFTDELNFDIEAGVDLRRGAQSLDQTLATIRPTLDFKLGQLTVKIGYSYSYAQYLNSSKSENQTLFISAQRAF